MASIPHERKRHKASELPSDPSEGKQGGTGTGLAGTGGKGRGRDLFLKKKMNVKCGGGTLPAENRTAKWAKCPLCGVQIKNWATEAQGGKLWQGESPVPRG